MTATHDDQLLAEFQASFTEDHDALDALLAPHTRSAILTIMGKVAATLLLAVDEPSAMRPDWPMVAQLNALPSITLKGTSFDIWAYNPRFKNGGSDAPDTVTLTYEIEKVGNETVAFEFDATLSLLSDGKTATTLDTQLRWADWGS